MKIDVNAYQKEKKNQFDCWRKTLLHRLLHSVQGMGGSTLIAQAFTLSVETKELFKPNEERDIDLYTVKKIVHPCLPVYSGWGVSKLHDGLVYGQKWQIYEVVPWMAY